MRHNIIKNHITNNSDPIKFKKGESLIVGEKYDGPEKWENWVYCTAVKGGVKGWVPEQIIQIEGTNGIALEDYDAYEMTIGENEEVILLKEMNGWYWCRNAGTNEEGWVPKECVGGKY